MYAVLDKDTQFEQQQEQILVLKQSSVEFKLFASHSSYSNHISHS